MYAGNVIHAYYKTLIESSHYVDFNGMGKQKVRINLT